jgi:hypothetical protein
VAVKTTKGATRYYYREEAPDTKYPSVTSIVDMLPKKFLQRWYANMAADLALDSIDYVQRMADRDREGAKKWLAGAAYRHTKRRSDIGSAAHDLFERMIRGEAIGRVHPDLEPYRRHFAEFLAAVNPELIRAEHVAWSDTHRYSGSFDVDMHVWLDDEGKPTPDRSGTRQRVMGDWKTSKSAWPSVALQIAAYANADKVIAPDGTEEPMPSYDAGYVLHITDTSWDFIPVDIGPKVFAHFLYLRETFDWEHSVAKTVLGAPVASSARTVTGTQRRG